MIAGCCKDAPTLLRPEYQGMWDVLGAWEIDRMVFFFFFGGVTQEVHTVLKEEAAVCPVCKSPASLVEYDNVVRVFFVPVWKWSGDNPAIKCSSCPFLMPRHKFDPVAAADRTPSHLLQCWSCSSPLESANFKFCPYCGASLWHASPCYTCQSLLWALFGSCGILTRAELLGFVLNSSRKKQGSVFYKEKKTKTY